MKITKEIPTTKTEVIEIKCDKCGTTYNKYEDLYELSEFHHIDFVGGYSSIFGDMTHIECDICQHCLKKMISGIYRESDDVWIC